MSDPVTIDVSFELWDGDFASTPINKRNNYQQDGVLVRDVRIGEHSCKLILVLDGHGGVSSRDFVMRHLAHDLMIECEGVSDWNTGRLGAKLVTVVARLHDRFVADNLGETTDGTTITLVLVQKATGACIVGNLGDSRLQAHPDSTWCALTTPSFHTIDQEAGSLPIPTGFVLRSRPGQKPMIEREYSGPYPPGISLSSSFGDLGKPYTPALHRELVVDHLPSGAKYLVLATDGFFDVWDKFKQVEHLRDQMKSVDPLTPKGVIGVLQTWVAQQKLQTWDNTSVCFVSIVPAVNSPSILSSHQ